MTETLSVVCLLFSLVMVHPVIAQPQGVWHKLLVDYVPATGLFSAQDTVHLPRHVKAIEFAINPQFQIEFAGEIVQPLPTSNAQRAVYRIATGGKLALTLSYSGVIKASAGRLFLSPSDYWYPDFALPIQGFALDIQRVKDWRFLSHGKYTQSDMHDSWRSDKPHQGLFLVGDTYHRYSEKHQGIDVSVWLLGPDQKLADTYLTFSKRYLSEYTDLFGGYPFAKFAVVENREQTGWGMASFTLLGSRVMRLPFIPHTSLPHEIVHNWLGNGIWVDYQQGNWSEGLTVYLADYHQKPSAERKRQYRMTALQRYSNDARDNKDQPIRQFISRHNAASQAIGYSKSMMLFHMIQQTVGSEAFALALKQLWQKQAFQRISIDQLIAQLSASKPGYIGKFQAWVDLQTAPQIELASTKIQAQGNMHKVQVELKHDTDVDLHIPIALEIANPELGKVHKARIWLQQTSQAFEFVLDFKPSTIAIDGGYNTLRRMHFSEQAPTLSYLLGGDASIVIPTRVAKAKQHAWLQLASALQQRFPELQIVSDDEALPTQHNAIILDKNNTYYAQALVANQRHKFQADDAEIKLQGQHYAHSQHLWLATQIDAQGHAVAVVDASTAQAIFAVAHRLPHYSSYGHLVFDAKSGKNLQKLALENPNNPLRAILP